jgi:carbamoyl-phosphate synthase small subunit
MTERTYLVLENGSIYDGRGFGFPAPLATELRPGIPGFTNAGEVVFNTAMVGYHEVLTDPSYTGQIVSMTYPHMGNYGHLDEWNESGPIRAADGGAAATTCDTRPIKVAGFVLRSLYRGPVPAGRITLDDYLRRHEIPGITEVDTRRLTLELRDHGSGNGVLVRPENPVLGLSPEELEAIEAYLDAFPKMEGRNLVSEVGSLETISLTAGDGPYRGVRLALYDCGTKANIIREFEKLGCEVTVYPSGSAPADILSGGHHAVMLSNGPGDPEVLKEQISTVKGLIGNIPVFGICLGHQLIAEALGATTYKMKFGHHGINHPVRDERTKKVFVTSQNHGFAVEEDSLPNGTEVWFRNANDGSVEGLRNDGLPVLSAQFHPESAPGPYDSHWIFEEFLKAIGPVGAAAEQGA